MRLHFDFSEYDDCDEPSRVLTTVTIPDGSGHDRVTDVYEKVVSMFFGYSINVKQDTSQLSFTFEDEDEFEDGENFKSCPNCVQGTCVFNCGKEFQ
jgi:hypothetical protein